MQSFFVRWLITSIAVFVASKIVPGIKCEDWSDLLVVSLLLGCCNAIVKPILMLVSLPLLIFTFGLFILVINSALLLLVDFLVPGFEVNGLWSAFLGSLIISIVTLILKPKEKIRVVTSVHSTQTIEGKDKVIDV